MRGRWYGGRLRRWSIRRRHQSRRTRGQSRCRQLDPATRLLLNAIVLVLRREYNRIGALGRQDFVDKRVDRGRERGWPYAMGVSTDLSKVVMACDADCLLSFMRGGRASEGAKMGQTEVVHLCWCTRPMPRASGGYTEGH
jgi:hypothetical protein